MLQTCDRRTSLLASSSAHKEPGLSQVQNGGSDHLVTVQVPSAQFRLLCALVMDVLESKKLLIMMDDVWPEDFACFQSGGLDLLAMRNGSRCLLSLRHTELVSRFSNVSSVALSTGSLDRAGAVRILAERARLDMTALAASKDLEVASHMCTVCRLCVSSHCEVLASWIVSELPN